MGYPGDNLEDYWPDQLLEEAIRQIQNNSWKGRYKKGLVKNFKEQLEILNKEAEKL